MFNYIKSSLNKRTGSSFACIIIKSARMFNSPFVYILSEYLKSIIFHFIARQIEELINCFWIPPLLEHSAQT